MTDQSAFDEVLARALIHAREHLGALDRVPVAARATKEELRGRLGRALANDGVDAIKVVDDLVADASEGLIGSGGGRFFAWVIGGSLPAALAADWVAAAWDQNAGLYATSPAAAIIEEVCGTWLKDLLGLPAAASFALVTGCQMSHVTCLAAARHRVLAAKGWDVERDGLAGAPPIRIITSDASHGSIERAARLLGLGREHVVALPANDRAQLTARSLEAALEAGRGKPAIVILQAGDINTGAFDPFEELVPVAHDHGAWVHVDGAFGLWANASPTHRAKLNGVEHCDSWSTDGHKWLNVPFDCGYAFVADRTAHAASLSYRASYLTHDDDARDEMDWNPEWSRRARGIATYAAIRQLGRSGIADLVDRCCRHAHAITTGIGALSGAELVWEPALNQGLVRYLDPRPGAGEEDHARRTDAVIAAIQRGGEAFFGGTTWRGKRCMRISVCNWRTNESDVERTVAAVAHALRDS